MDCGCMRPDEGSYVFSVNDATGRVDRMPARRPLLGFKDARLEWTYVGAKAVESKSMLYVAYCFVLAVNVVGSILWCVLSLNENVGGTVLNDLMDLASPGEGITQGILVAVGGESPYIVGIFVVVLIYELDRFENKGIVFHITVAVFVLSILLDFSLPLWMPSQDDTRHASTVFEEMFVILFGKNSFIVSWILKFLVDLFFLMMAQLPFRHVLVGLVVSFVTFVW